MDTRLQRKPKKTGSLDQEIVPYSSCFFLVPTALKRKKAAACRNEVFIKSFHHIVYTRLHRKQLAKEIKEKENLMNFACKKTSHSISKRCFVFSSFLFPLSLSINSLSYSSFLHFLFHLLFLISRSTNFLTFYTFFPSFFPLPLLLNNFLCLLFFYPFQTY